MDQSRVRMGSRAGAALLLAVAVACLAGMTAGTARADDPTAVELIGNWFGQLTTPVGSVPVELQVLSAEHRRFEWSALEDFGGGFVEVATGDGTLSASGQGQIHGDGAPGNPAGLLEIKAHGSVQGPAGAMTAGFDFRGRNVDGTTIAGMITLAQGERPK